MRLLVALMWLSLVATASAQPVSEQTREFERERYEKQRDARHQAEEEARELRRRQEKIFTRRGLGREIPDGVTREEFIESIDPDAPQQWDDVDDSGQAFVLWLVGLMATALAFAGFIVFLRSRSRSALATDGAFESVDTRTGDALGTGLADVSTVILAIHGSARDAFESIEGDAFDQLRGAVRELLASKLAWLAAGTIDVDPAPSARARADLRRVTADLHDRVQGTPADDRGVFVVAISVAGGRDLGGFSMPQNAERLEQRLRHLAQLLPDELVGVEVNALPTQGTLALQPVSSALGLTPIDESTLDERVFCEHCGSPMPKRETRCAHCRTPRRIAPV